MRRIALLLTLLIFPAATLSAQTDNGGIKQDTKDAAHSTAKATKKTGRKVKHGNAKKQTVKKVRKLPKH